jgi:hypothetical protein
MRIWMRRIISAAVVIALFLIMQRLVQPKYASDLIEGSFTSEYYAEEADHQVLMVGDCELYENFDPVTLWENYGITSYIRGNAQQLTWQSYYLLKEALKKETPEVVIFNVLELKYDEPQKEEYNRLTLDNMKWSSEKIGAVYASMTEDENFLDYLFPILRYHSRITELNNEDFTYFASAKQQTVSGYYMRVDTSPYAIGQWGDENHVGTYTDEYLEAAAAFLEESEAADDDEWSADASDDGDDDWSADASDDGDDDWSADASDDGDDDEWSADASDEEVDEADDSDDEIEYDPDWAPANTDDSVDPLGDNAMHYLDLIRELCEEKGIMLLLVKAPSVSPAWYDKWEEQIVEYADEYKLDYLNYLPLVDEIGIDFATDTYDEGLHMNYYGAVKCADYLGDYLVRNYGLEDLRSDEKISAVWEKKAKAQQEVIKSQLSEIEEYGKVMSY